MKYVTKSHKQEWFKISKVIDLLKKRNIEYDFSVKHVLENANQYGLFDKYPDHPLSSKDNISVYFFSKEIINARILNNNIDTEFCLGEIEFSGYIHLKDRNIQELLDNDETIIHGFFPPTQEDKNIRNIFHKYKQDIDFEWSFANLCEISEKQRPIIKADDIKNLLIYRSDIAKIVRSYKKIKNILSADEKLVDPCLLVEESVQEKKRRKPEIDNYKEATANCFARLIWGKYKNILVSDLSTFWFFDAIFSYKFKDCKNDDFFIKINTIPVKNNNNRDKGSNKTIKNWIKKSIPKNLILNGRAKTTRKENSICEFHKMENETKPILNSIIEILIRSLEYYDPNNEIKFNMFPGRIDLDIIVDKIRDDSPQLRDDQFWSTFLIQNNLSLKSLKSDQIEAELPNN